MCMDRLLREARASTTLITSKNIPDYSGNVAVATKDMIITALSQMSRMSNAFRFVDYEVDIVRQDTVQNLTTILLNNNQLQLQRPALYVSGAVAFLDRSVISKQMDIGVSGTDAEAGYSRTRGVSLMGLDLHLGDFRTRTLIPGLDSANEIVIGNGGRGLDLAGRINSYGVQFNVGRDYTQGTGPAMRTLVELATIELVGKWARLPYWQCLTLDQTHPDFQRQLLDWYEEGSPGARQSLVQRALGQKGYLRPQAEILPGNDPVLVNVLGQFQADSGIVATGVLDFSTYERALRDFVSLDRNGGLARVGWVPSGGGLPVANLQPGAAGGSEGVRRTVELRVENLFAGRAGFAPAEQVFLTARVSRNSHLYCYLANASGVMRLLPNETNSQSLVAANHAIRIPDWMSPTPGFILQADRPGIESVTCLATDRPILAELPEVFRGEPIRPIPGIRNVAELLQAHDGLADSNTFTQARAEWRVLESPRGTASAVPAAPTASASATAR